MKRTRIVSLAILAATLAAALMLPQPGEAQFSKITEAKDFKLPLFYPASNGVQRIKTVIAGERWRFVTNGIVHLIKPGITNYHPDGTMEWIAIAPECTVNVNTKEASGHTNIYFRTADSRFVQTGVGFLWKQSDSVLIVSNKVHTWIDKQALTKAASTNK